MQKISMKIPVFKGKTTKTERMEDLFKNNNELLVNSKEYKVVDKITIKFVKHLINNGLSIGVNGKGLLFHLTANNLFDIVQIEKDLIIILVKTCHVLQLPKINFDIIGRPTVGQRTTTARIAFSIPKGKEEFIDFCNNFLSFVFILPHKYRRS